MLNRRQFLQQSTLMLISSKIPNLNAQQTSQEEGYDDFFSRNIPTLEQLGTKRPMRAKVDQAKTYFLVSTKG